ncbi:MAG TPA: hypothetical protein VNW92_27090, partial [Polyangiaceae bacterium]|nr:hypothetical protein [Polyangiaceae bacterium]
MNTLIPRTHSRSASLLTPPVGLRQPASLWALAALLALAACTTGNVDDPSVQGGSGNTTSSQSGAGGQIVGAGGNSTVGAGGSGNGSGASGGAIIGGGGTSTGAGGTSTGAGGTSTGAGGTTAPGMIGTTDPSGQPTLPNGRGAIMPFTEYEAEAGTVMGGSVLGPTRNVDSANDIAAEASGKKAVRLASTGAYVEFTNLNASNSIVVRYSI